MNKVLVFDMDGTIANLYRVDGWLADLRVENVRPYVEAEPMWDMILLIDVLNELKIDGWKIVVTTWTAKNGSKKYNKRTAKVKKEWLDRFDFPYDEFHAIKYGTTKLNATRKHSGFQILIDDNEKIRKGWNGGKSIDPTTCDLIETLANLL